jgi:hypothetical protein
MHALLGLEVQSKISRKVIFGKPEKFTFCAAGEIGS